MAKLVFFVVLAFFTLTAEFGGMVVAGKAVPERYESAMRSIKKLQESAYVGRKLVKLACIKYTSCPTSGCPDYCECPLNPQDYNYRCQELRV